jgi:hypothetical protein
MSAKMNWDRVRKETPTRRSGSEWIGSDAVGATPSKEIKPSRKRQSMKRSQPPGRSRMLDCKCGKVIGFRGSHKKKCPLSNGLNLRVNSSANHNSFSECIRKTGELPPTREFLSSLETAIEIAQSLSDRDRQGGPEIDEGSPQGHSRHASWFVTNGRLRHKLRHRGRRFPEGTGTCTYTRPSHA